MASGETCSNCGGSSLFSDTHGALEILVCVDCGAYREAQLGGDADEFCPSKPRDFNLIADGPTRQGKFFVPKDYRKDKERKFRKLLNDMATSVRLPEYETKVCIEEGIALLRDGKIGQNMRNFAAGLVFIALQRTSARVSYKEVEKLVDVKQATLGRVVKQLKQLSQVGKREVIVSDEEKMQVAVDKLPPDISREEKMEAKKRALGLKELCKDVKVQRVFVCSNQTADCALLVIALESIQNQTKEDVWIDKFAKALGVTSGTLKNRIWQLRTALVDRAEQLHSLGCKVDSKQITVRNVQAYVSRLIKNKNFLLINPDRPSEPESDSEREEGTGSSSTVPVLLTDPMYQPPSEEAEGNLSDLDIEEYIASEKEVANKKKMYGEPS